MSRGRNAGPLHLELPGCIVNIVNATDTTGAPVTSIEIIADYARGPDGARLSRWDDVPWSIDGVMRESAGIRVIRGWPVCASCNGRHNPLDTHGDRPQSAH